MPKESAPTCPAASLDAVRPFAYTGMTNVLGLSHTLPRGDALSWGMGATTVRIDPVDLRWSAGVFHDRDGSLLWSVIVNGAEGYAVRANLYPGGFAGGKPWWSRAGLFAGITDDGEGVFGVQWMLPIGVGG